jgi:hypothetical protein
MWQLFAADEPVLNLSSVQDPPVSSSEDEDVSQPPVDLSAKRSKSEEPANQAVKTDGAKSEPLQQRQHWSPTANATQLVNPATGWFKKIDGAESGDLQTEWRKSKRKLFFFSKKTKVFFRASKMAKYFHYITRGRGITYLIASKFSLRFLYFRRFFKKRMEKVYFCTNIGGYLKVLPYLQSTFSELPKRRIGVFQNITRNSEWRIAFVCFFLPFWLLPF